jgi:hypothetical protein
LALYSALAPVKREGYPLIVPMSPSSYAIGQAVFIRTDVADYLEETVPFKSLDELVRVCTVPRENMTLEKIVVFSMVNNEAVALTLGFISASIGRRPGAEVKEPWQQ